MQVVEDKLAAATTDMASLSQQQEQGTPAATALRASIAAQQKEIDAMQRRSNEITDRLFADFSRKVCFKQGYTVLCISRLHANCLK